MDLFKFAIDCYSLRIDNHFNLAFNTMLYITVIQDGKVFIIVEYLNNLRQLLLKCKDLFLMRLLELRSSKTTLANPMF